MGKLCTAFSWESDTLPALVTLVTDNSRAKPQGRRAQTNSRATSLADALLTFICGFDLSAGSAAQPFENQLTDRELPGSKPQGIWAEVVHLQDNAPFKPGVNSWRGHVDGQSEAGERAAALYAGRYFRSTRKLDPFMGDA